jgi:hypothetical protein
MSKLYRKAVQQYATRQLLSRQSLCNVFRVRSNFLQVLGYARTLFWSKHWDSGKDTAQRYGCVVNIVHQSDGFSGERHGLLSSF